MFWRKIYPPEYTLPQESINVLGCQRMSTNKDLLVYSPIAIATNQWRTMRAHLHEMWSPATFALIPRHLKRQLQTKLGTPCATIGTANSMGQLIPLCSGNHLYGITWRPPALHRKRLGCCDMARLSQLWRFPWQYPRPAFR